jgi:hypothetical protein
MIPPQTKENKFTCIDFKDQIETCKNGLNTSSILDFNDVVMYTCYHNHTPTSQIILKIRHVVHQTRTMQVINVTFLADAFDSASVNISDLCDIKSTDGF